MDQLALLSDPEQILAQAAAAAEAAALILPKLEEEAEEMEELLRKKRDQIESVRTLAERFRPMSNVALRPTEPPKSAAADVDFVLSMMGPIGVAEMLDWMKEHLGRAWAQSTVWNLLKRGKDAGKYVNENNKWSMAAGEGLV